jgi:predicted aminopeptidase
MVSMISGRLIQVAAIACIGMTLSGCYYMQAARGQLDVMQRSEPIADVVAASDTPTELSRRLELVEEARDFSISELGLPDNDSYRSYADLERDYVVWNVFAAREFSLELKTWCFPVAGCVGYRGYFSEETARRKAAELRDQGFDVVVGGIAAYSTLGRFDDPILNTMMHWQDEDLIATMFHELAHQVLYVKGDTEFNESFATVVEQVGIDRWLQGRGDKEAFLAYTDRREFRRGIVEKVAATGASLQRLYMTRIAPAEMRRRKSHQFEILSGDLRRSFERSGRDAPRWVSENLNNARIASMALYHQRVPEFRRLLSACDDSLECFYTEARRLAESES